MKFSSSRSFNPENSDYIRIIVMQNEATVNEAFHRLREIGIRYDMELPNGISEEYENFLETYFRNDF